MSVHVHRRLGAAAPAWEAAFAAAGPAGAAAPLRDADIVVAGEVRGRAARRATAAGRGLWLAAGYPAAGGKRRPRLPPADALARAGAVLAADDGTRAAVETAVPETTGRVFVVPDPQRESHAAAAILRRLLHRYLPRPETPARRAGARFGLVGYNLKFFNRVLHHLDAIPWLETRVDEWPRFAVHDPDATREVVHWADLIMCEWAGPNLVFACRHKQPGQKLITRLHRFELYADHWRDVDIEAVDAVVTVSPHYRRLVLETTGWPQNKVRIIPNWVDDLELDRPKLDDARFHLGVLGASTARKRLDRSVAVLEKLHRSEPRFHLFVKSEMPWEMRWVWEDPEERAHFDPLFERLRRPPLAAAVTFDPFGPDVGYWLRKIGFVLSTSDDESFHLAPAEGMASGAVPAVWTWPGAADVYASRWLASSVDEMAAAIQALAADTAAFDAAAAAARAEVLSAYRLDDVLQQWVDLVCEILGGR